MHTNPATNTRSLARAVIVIALLVTSTACSPEEAAAPTADSPEQPTTVAEAPSTVEIVARDYLFEMPETVPVGTTLTLRNSSNAEVHEAVAIRLPDDETRTVAELMQLPPEELAAFFPLVETVIVAPPGAEGLVVEGTGTLTEPGRYAVICVIPTGADPEVYMRAAAEAEGGPPDVPGGPPHIANGMFAELTVGG